MPTFNFDILARSVSLYWSPYFAGDRPNIAENRPLGDLNMYDPNITPETSSKIVIFEEVSGVYLPGDRLVDETYFTFKLIFLDLDNYEK